MLKTWTADEWDSIVGEEIERLADGQGHIERAWEYAQEHANPDSLDDPYEAASEAVGQTA